MKEEQGREAVWAHAEEADLQEFIRKVAAVFPVGDIAIHTPGKLTYVNERPRPPKFRVGLKVNPITGRLIK